MKPVWYIILYNGNEINKIIDIIEEEINVILKADFNIVLEELRFAEIFWLTTVCIDNDDKHKAKLNVGKINDIILIPSINRILVRRIL